MDFHNGLKVPRGVTVNTVVRVQNQPAVLQQRVGWFGQPVHYADNMVIKKLAPYDQIPE